MCDNWRYFRLKGQKIVSNSVCPPPSQLVTLQLWLPAPSLPPLSLFFLLQSSSSRSHSPHTHQTVAAAAEKSPFFLFLRSCLRNLAWMALRAALLCSLIGSLLGQGKSTLCFLGISWQLVSTQIPLIMIFFSFSMKRKNKEMINY